MLYLKHRLNVIRFSCVILEFAFSSIVMTFLYTNMCIVYDFYRCLDFLIMLFILKFSFHYLFIIKYDFVLFLILNVLILRRSRFVLINIFSIVFFFKLSLHFVFKKFLIFLINIVVIVLVSSLFINAIISFFSIDIFMIIIIVFFIEYDAHNNFDLLIISINFFYLRYQFDEFLFDLYIRYLSS